MHTEDDLRTAMLEFVDHNEPDEHAVRTEIEHRLSAPEHHVVHPAFRTRLSTLTAIAACVAVVVAVAAGVHFSRSHSSERPGTSFTPTPVMTVLGDIQLPGTNLLTIFHGTGSKSIVIGNPTIPLGYTLAAVFKCRGSGGMSVGGVSSIPGCSPEGTWGATLTGQTGTLQVVAPASSTWQIALVTQPLTRTNADMSTGEDSAFTTDNGRLGIATGQGNSTVHLKPADSADRFRIWLKCTGDGVTIVSPDKSVKNDYTQTCFAGWNYIWDIPKGTVPSALTITASAGTTWTVVVTPL